ncbi:MAG: hypothetical protein Q8R47_02525 [Nanoarchaeota archaeon]|nr:hypothetical protein [Nanoarchaeota archaeon]
MLDKDKITLLIQEIKKKKELQSIDDHFVEESLRKYLQQEQKLLKSLQENFNPKSKAYSTVVKQVRSQLRRVYGLFRDDPQERKKLIQELLEAPPAKRAALVQQILSTHSSTQERLPVYEQLYSKIFSITGKPRTILDLGGGINPFSFSYMKLGQCTYHVYDINEEEIQSINHYFQMLHQENPSFIGKALIFDIAAANVTFPKADLAFLFKMTDVIDQGKGHKKTEELLQKIPAKYIVVSFATKTMSGKAMTAPRRSWMEWLCKRLGYGYTILEFANELFYVVKK